MKERNIKMSSSTKSKQEASLSVADQPTDAEISTVLLPSNSSSAVRRPRSQSRELDNDSVSHSEDSAGSEEQMEASPPIQFL